MNDPSTESYRWLQQPLEATSKFLNFGKNLFYMDFDGSVLRAMKNAFAIS